MAEPAGSQGVTPETLWKIGFSGTRKSEEMAGFCGGGRNYHGEFAERQPKGACVGWVWCTKLRKLALAAPPQGGGVYWCIPEFAHFWIELRYGDGTSCHIQ